MQIVVLAMEMVMVVMATVAMATVAMATVTVMLSQQLQNNLHASPQGLPAMLWPASAHPHAQAT